MRVISTAPPKHLIKLMPTEAEQYAYCKSIGCYFECEWCVGYSESMPKRVEYPKKAKIIETKVQVSEISKFDNLAQKALAKGFKKHEHPLWDYIIEKFTKG